VRFALVICWSTDVGVALICCGVENLRKSLSVTGGEISRLSAANSTADRAIDLLLLFLQKPILRTQEICDELGMPRSTAYRYLSSLRSYALLSEDSRGHWRLGPQILPLARAAMAGNSILDVSGPVLSDLNERCGEAVALYERVGHESFLLTRIESRHRVRLVYSRGQILPWPGSASAKVLLAFASEEERKELFALLKPVQYTPQTVKTKDALKAAIQKIRRDGFAYSDQERDEGIRAIAAPVESNAEVRHCITISGPAFRLTDVKIKELRDGVLDAARKISAELRKFEM
jgi:DNA-binding IclR family transcriptional regulator